MQRRLQGSHAILLTSSLSSGFGVLLMRNTGALKNTPSDRLSDSWRPRPFEQRGARPDSGCAASFGCRLPPESHAATLGRAPPRRTRPLTHAPGAPTRAGPSPAPPTQPRAPGARAPLLRGARGGSCRSWDELSEDAAARGASPPSVHQSPDTSEIRLWVCGERNATQTPFYRTPRKYTRTGTHTDVAATRACRGGSRPRAAKKEPGTREGPLPTPQSPRCRRSGSAAKRCDVSARRHRPGLTAQRRAWGLHRRGGARPGGTGRGRAGRRGRSGRKGAGEEERGRDLSCAARYGGAQGGPETGLRLSSDAPAGTRRTRARPSLARLAGFVKRRSPGEDGRLRPVSVSVPASAIQTDG